MAVLLFFKWTLQLYLLNLTNGAKFAGSVGHPMTKMLLASPPWPPDQGPPMSPTELCPDTSNRKSAPMCLATYKPSSQLGPGSNLKEAELFLVALSADLVSDVWTRIWDKMLTRTLAILVWDAKHGLCNGRLSVRLSHSSSGLRWVCWRAFSVLYTTNVALR